MELKEIERLAFLKYKLNGARAMNTFIFTQAKNNKLTDEEIDKLILKLHIKIEKYIKENEKKYNTLKIKEIKGSMYILA